MITTRMILLIVVCFFVCEGVVAATPVPVTENNSRTPSADQEVAVTYDGVWFLGFNIKRPVFAGEKGLELRRKIAAGIHREHIAKDIIGALYVPDSIIPPGMSGYQKGSIPGQATINATVQEPTHLVILYTDGVKTVQAAEEIRSDLEKIGITVSAVTANYARRLTFEDALREGAYDIFLMGYKTQSGTTGELLEELFSTQGTANFFGIADREIDAMLKTSSENEKVYNAVQEKIWDKRLLVPIFYIEKSY